MELTITPEFFIDLIVTSICFTAAYLTYIEPRVKKIKSLFYIRLGIIFMGLFFLLDGLSILYLSSLVSLFSAYMLVPTTIFLTIGINFIFKETYNSFLLIIEASLGSVLVILSLLPNSVLFELEYGYITVNWAGPFSFVGDFYLLIPLILVFYWGLKTWLNAPVFIKRQANVFFLGTVIVGPLNMVIFLLYYWEPIFILIADIIGALGTLVFNLAIFKEPKLLYILPFRLYRILVKDRAGFPLFDHDWSQSKINEKVFTGFVNAVQLMSKEIIDLGGLLDINLEKGLLIVNESDYITVGLLSSKSSKLLKETLKKFTSDFEQKFQKELKQELKNPQNYEGAFELIEKYFSNFPYGTVTSRKQQLILAGKYPQAFMELENKMRDIFTNDEEYNLIKTEVQKTPFTIIPDFMSLYKEIKEEMNELTTEEKKELEKRNDVDV